VIGASIHPQEDIPGRHIVGEQDPPERVVGHAGRAADRRESSGTGPIAQHQERMDPVVGGERLVGAATVTDQVAALWPVLHVDHPDCQ
jgi:hypothetical protein